MPTVGQPGFYSPKRCWHCTREYLPVAGMQRYCKECRRPGHRLVGIFYGRCQRPGCHNLLFDRRRIDRCGGKPVRWCGPSCREGSRRTPVTDRAGPGAPGRIVADRVARGRSLEALAAQAHCSVEEIRAILAAHLVDPDEEPIPEIPERLLVALARR